MEVVGLINGENRRLKKPEVCAKRSIKRHLHTTHVGAVRWEPQNSSTTTCSGKVDHELPVNYSGGTLTLTHGLAFTSSMRTDISHEQWQPWTAVSPVTVTCDQAFFFLRANEARGKKNSSRERHRGILGRGCDFRLPLLGLISMA